MLHKVHKVLHGVTHQQVRGGFAALAAGVALAVTAGPLYAAQPIKIGVIAPAAAIDGKSIFQGAELAAEQINAKGGIAGRQIKLIEYDDHASASDGVRAFQRAARQDRVVAMVGNFISEVALAVEPWAARLKVPYIITGAASTQLNKNVGNHWPAYKYIYMENLNSYFLARNVCDAAHDILVKQLHYKTAVIMREDAAWTKPLGAEYDNCLPKAGLKVLDEIVFSPDTNDFSPIYNKIEGLKPDAIITGIAHVGVKPTVQWHNQQVPVFMGGWSSQAGASTFWNATNGATEGVMTGNLGAGDASLTPQTKSFAATYTKKFNTSPAYNAYTTYDAIHVLKNAIERAKSTNNNKLVAALAKTDYEGTIGQVQFYDHKAKFPHAMKYGAKYVTGVALQWQAGKQVTIWPPKAASGKVMVPDFVKKGQ